MNEVLRAVPRVNVWVTCPECSGPAHVLQNRVVCTGCAWTREGARPGHWCACCRKWEADRPVTVKPARTVLWFRCGVCGARKEELRPHVVRQRHGTPVPACSCGSPMLLDAHWFRGVDSPAVRDGFDALYGLPFHLAVACAGHTLWVANLEHLDHVESFIAAKHRLRLDFTDESTRYWELCHWLPAWIIRAKNRTKVLAGLRKLRRMEAALPGGAGRASRARL